VLQTERVGRGAIEKAAQELTKAAASSGPRHVHHTGVVRDLATHTRHRRRAGHDPHDVVPRTTAIAALGVERRRRFLCGRGRRLARSPRSSSKYGLLGAHPAPQPRRDQALANTRSDALPAATGRWARSLSARRRAERAGVAVDERRYRLQSGMQVAGEIHLGTRSPRKPSPVQRAFHSGA
jgi:hypothetical protein